MGACATYKSTSGSITYYRGTPIFWSAKLQSLTATSTCEAETLAMFDAAMIVESQGFLDEILDSADDHFSAIPLLFCDNKSAIAVAASSLPTKRSRHYNIRLSRLRELSSSIQFVPTDYNKADPFTKALEARKYRLLWWTDPYDPKVKVKSIIGNEIKTYQRKINVNSLNSWNGQLVELDDDFEGSVYEFENSVKSFYSSYTYKGSSKKDSGNFDIFNCKNIKFYKLKF